MIESMCVCFYEYLEGERMHCEHRARAFGQRLKTRLFVEAAPPALDRRAAHCVPCGDCTYCICCGHIIVALCAHCVTTVLYCHFLLYLRRTPKQWGCGEKSRRKSRRSTWFYMERALHTRVEWHIMLSISIWYVLLAGIVCYSFSTETVCVCVCVK